MTAGPWRLSLGLLLGAALLVLAYLVINTTFMAYDDEGYLLVSIRHFLGGAPLYDEVFSQYGPWPFLYHQIVTGVLQQPLTHALGRNLTALHWVLCAMLCGAIAMRLTARHVAALGSTLMAFCFLWQMNAEPSHPGSLAALMIALVAFAAITLHASGHWDRLGAVVGIAAALLLTTKINVGLLFVAGAGACALRMTDWPERWRRPAELLAGLGLIALPWVLMWGRLGVPWVQAFALHFSIAAAGVAWVTPSRSIGRPIPARTWVVALAGFMATLALVVIAICLQGTSMPALMEAVLVRPLRLPANFMLGLSWPAAMIPISVVCAATTIWAGWQVRRTGSVGLAAAGAVVAVRMAAMIALMINAAGILGLSGIGLFAMYALPLLPLFVIPVMPDFDPSERRPGAQAWLAGIALPAILTAYPVAGSQLAFGAFLLVPILVIGFAGALSFLERVAAHAGRWLPQAGWGVLVVAGAAQFALLAGSSWERYRTAQPLALPGSVDLRLGEHERLALRALTLNARVHADVLFSRPGMFSFNLWSGVPTPTMQNATQWFWLLDESAQQRIVARLHGTKRSAIITHTGLDAFIESIGVPMGSALQAHVRDHYRPLFEANGYQFLVPLDSRAVAFGRIQVEPSGRPGSGSVVARALQANVVLDGVPATVQLRGKHSPWPVLIDYSSQGAAIDLQPISADGDSLGAAIPLPADRALHGLFRLSVRSPQEFALDPAEDPVLAVLAPNGDVLSESTAPRPSEALP